MDLESKRTAEELLDLVKDKNTVALDSDSLPPALQKLIGLYLAAPSAAQKWLDAAVFDLLMASVPRLTMLLQFGPALSMDDVGSLRKTYSEAMAEAEQMGGEEYTLPPTLKEGAGRIAEEIDKVIRSYLITAANEKYVNRDAHLDIVAGHAIIIRGILGLTNLPDDYDGEGSVE